MDSGLERGFNKNLLYYNISREMQHLSAKSVTSFGQLLPENWEEKLALFKLFVKNETKGVQMLQVGNMDEFAISFDMSIQYPKKEPKIWEFRPMGWKSIGWYNVEVCNKWFQEGENLWIYTAIHKYKTFYSLYIFVNKKFYICE